ncbi:RNA methyltransferase, TrmH family, group 3 [Atopobium deltae]|uniref:RNA methyltransferase, TrmH family, group 3 n=1 Tax=Atopobium deltae TaxID=1393034 RepID=A0A133XQ55_9ACTN|nr:RNA methyltransferase, TrmH family, group 3 [Atopobium deltae]
MVLVAKRTTGKRPAGKGKRPTTEKRSTGKNPASKRPATGNRPVASKRPTPRRSPEHSYDLIEGRRAVYEALDAGVPLAKALIARQNAEQDASFVALCKRLQQEGVACEEVSRQVLDSLSSHGAHQGIVVRTQPFVYAQLDDILDRATADHELVLILDHVTDEGNFGAIIRSAEVVGSAGVVIAKARAARVGTAVYKTSAGAVFHTPIAQVSNLASAIDTLKEKGFWVAGATEHAQQLAWDAPLHGRLALVVGSEGKGISQLLLKKCDFSCKLPQRGIVESLNVAQATTALCFEWLRQSTGLSSDLL